MLLRRQLMPVAADSAYEPARYAEFRLASRAMPRMEVIHAPIITSVSPMLVDNAPPYTLQVGNKRPLITWTLGAPTAAPALGGPGGRAPAASPTAAVAAADPHTFYPAIAPPPPAGFAPPTNMVSVPALPPVCTVTGSGLRAQGSASPVSSAAPAVVAHVRSLGAAVSVPTHVGVGQAQTLTGGGQGAVRPVAVVVSSSEGEQPQALTGGGQGAVMPPYAAVAIKTTRDGSSEDMRVTPPLAAMTVAVVPVSPAGLPGVSGPINGGGETMDANLGLLIAYSPMAVVDSDMVKGLLPEARGSTVQSGLGRLPRSPASSTATAASSKKDKEAAKALAQ